MIAFSAAGLLAASVMIVPLALLAEGMPDPVAAGPVAMASVLYLGIFPTAIATLLLVTVIQSAGPTFLTQSNYQVPIWSVLFGTLLLGERLPASFLAALGLILAGIALTNAPLSRQRH
jgi:drug/metabolite transporter (DMT)-like permease